jgi:hypothetical protein
MHRHAEAAEERDGLGNWQCAQHATNDGSASSPEIPFCDSGVGDVAARSAADQDLGAGPPCALEHGDRQCRREAAREDGSGQAGGAPSDDRRVKQGRPPAL